MTLINLVEMAKLLKKWIVDEFSIYKKGKSGEFRTSLAMRQISMHWTPLKQQSPDQEHNEVQETFRGIGGWVWLFQSGLYSGCYHLLNWKCWVEEYKGVLGRIWEKPCRNFEFLSAVHNWSQRRQRQRQTWWICFWTCAGAAFGGFKGEKMSKTPRLNAGSLYWRGHTCELLTTWGNLLVGWTCFLHSWAKRSI